MEAFLDALYLLTSIEHLLYLSLGVVIGLIVAILPGMGGTVGLSLVLPFIFGMDQTSALALMIGLLSVTCTGDTFPSILMGIPGSSSSQATVCDGYPLARDGQAARALGAAFSASLAGGLFGAIVLTGAMFAARPLIMAIGMGEQMLLIILALTMVGMLGGQNIAKGLAACGIGLLVGSMGAAPATGQTRFSFDTVYLSDGIPLTVLALGMFAMPEIISLLRQKSTISTSGKLDAAGWRQGLRDTWKARWLVLRCSGIGSLIGILPGLGGSVVDWIAYGHAVQTTKDRENFGKGDIRGVIAPESANNAKEGGSLVPTLFFGIPGSGSMALLLGGFVLIGIQPGVQMVTQDLYLSYTVIWSLALANVLGAGICIILAPKIARLTTVPYGYIGPLMIVLIIFTSFQATRAWGDLLALFVVSLLGIYMKRFGWSRPALVIGYVLSAGLESTVYQTVQVYGFSFLMRPQSLVILGIIAVSVYAGWRIVQQSQEAKDDCSIETMKRRRRMPQLLFSLILLAAIGCAVYSIQDTTALTKMYPVSVAAVTALLLIAVAVQQTTKPVVHSSLADTEQMSSPGDTKSVGLFYYMGWTAFMLALVWLVGYTLATALFVVIFLIVEVRTSILRSLCIGGGTVALLALLAFGLTLDYPQGMISHYVEMPYWLQ